MLGYCLSRDIDFSEPKRRRMKYDRNSRRCPSFMTMHLALCEGFVNLPVIDERIGKASVRPLRFERSRAASLRRAFLSRADSREIRVSDGIRESRRFIATLPRRYLGQRSGKQTSRYS